MLRDSRPRRWLTFPFFCVTALAVLAASCGGNGSKGDAPKDAGAGSASAHPLATAASWRSTERLAQLTGNYDPEGKPHFGNTVPWGVEGVDLGANTEYDGRTIIFFGDEARAPYADPVAVIDDVAFPRNGHVAMEWQTSNQLDAFFIGNDGALYVAWIVDGHFWEGPHRISPLSTAPPGAPVAAAKQTAEKLDVFYVGDEGQLLVSSVSGDGVWQAPFQISGQGTAPPGAGVAAAPQSANQLDAFFVGNDEKLHVHWVVGQGTDWAGPTIVGDLAKTTAPPGASVAAIQQNTDLLAVTVIGKDRKPTVHWVHGGGTWQGPSPMTENADFAPPGGSVAAIRRGLHRASMVFVGDNEKLTELRSDDGAPWQGPFEFDSTEIAPPGGNIALVKQETDVTSALFVGYGGKPYVHWVSGEGNTWSGPIAMTSAGSVASAGAPIAAAKQTESVTIGLYGGLNDEMLVSWLPRGQPWQGPGRINPEMLNLRPVLGANGKFHPYTIREGGQTRPLEGDGTPTGAFSYDGKAFVFSGANEKTCPEETCPVLWTPWLTASSRPMEPAPFDLLFRLPPLGPQGAPGGKFLQIAPSVVRGIATRLPGFHSPTADGAFLLGQATILKEDKWQGGVHLAWLPLTPGRNPELSDIRYYTGSGTENWSPNQSDAVPLFTTVFPWASLSFGEIPGTNLWIVIYHAAGDRQNVDAPIKARIASTPWDLASAQDIEILDPVRDASYRYMYRCTGAPLPTCDPNNLYPRKVENQRAAFLYGPHLLNRYTRYDPQTKVVTLHYLVSTAWPYQVQLMESTLQLN
ncbi:hypothetical protein LVJ94_04075 [Pendulispora rubella]|uniref:Uncharacterized protein n=1 Tax=Pendulispora rubella TaxID=2741070 RepID=A0ABZ2L6C3_9BACT